MTTYRTIEIDGGELFYREAGDSGGTDPAAPRGLPELVGAVRAADRPPRRPLPPRGARLPGVRTQPGPGRRDHLRSPGGRHRGVHRGEGPGALQPLHVRLRRAGRVPAGHAPPRAHRGAGDPERQRLRDRLRAQHAGPEAVLGRPRRQRGRDPRPVAARRHAFAVRRRRPGPGDGQPGPVGARPALPRSPRPRPVMLDLLFDYRATSRSTRPGTSTCAPTNRRRCWRGAEHDAYFPEAGARAYLQDLPAAELHLLDTGHFATATHSREIAELIGAFLARHETS